MNRSSALVLVICFILLQTIIDTLALSPLGRDGEGQDYYNKIYLRYENYIYADNIKTVRLHRLGFEMSEPVLELNDNTTSLELSFDDFGTTLKNYSFTVIHCDADWQPSDLNPFDYIEGFQEQYIRDYQYSFGTYVQYTHYKVNFPNDNFKLTKSGNYLLKVYLDDPDSLVLVRRFMVTDLKVSVKGSVKRSSIVKNMDEQHEVHFSILYSGYNIVNPIEEIKTVLVQNSRWDNAKTDLKPLFLKPNELVYDYTAETTFEAGNEFRYFDFQNLRYYTDRVKTITYESKQNHVYLFSDKVRKYKSYISGRDINGAYVIHVNLGNDSGVEADYAHVHFKLPYDEEIQGADVYIFGGLTDWRIDTMYKMKYSAENFSYDASIFLKQGYYEYEYVLVDDKGKIDDTYFEGSFYQTEDKYTVYVYHRQPGSRYDQLIGMEIFNSTGLY